MDTEEARRAVEQALASIAPEADLARLRRDVPLREQVDLDSMDWLNFVALLHEKLGIDVPEEDYPRLATLAGAVDYLALQRETQAPPSPAPVAGPGLVPPTTTHWLRGTPVTVRPMRPDDVPLEADFVRHLSSDSRYKRFMLTLRELSPDKLKYLTHVDQDRHVALVATVEREGHEIEIGVVRYIVDPAGGSCEFAIAVDDAWQKTGLAGVLMHELMRVARSRGLPRMEGIVLATNTSMLRFTRQLGFSVEHDPEDRSTVRVVRSLQTPGRTCD